MGYIVIYKGIDKGLLEAIGPTGIKKRVIKVAGQLSYIQGGKVYNYIVIIVVYMVTGIWGII